MAGGSDRAGIRTVAAVDKRSDLTFAALRRLLYQ